MRQYMIVTQAADGSHKHEYVGIDHETAVDLIKEMAERRRPEHVMKIHDDMIVIWDDGRLLKVWACQTDVRRMGPDGITR